MWGTPPASLAAIFFAILCVKPSAVQGYQWTSLDWFTNSSALGIPSPQDMENWPLELLSPVTDAYNNNASSNFNLTSGNQCQMVVVPNLLTFNNSTMPWYHISKSFSSQSPNPAIVIISGLYGSDVLSMYSAAKVFSALLNAANGTIFPEVFASTMMASVDFVLLPIANPDGYAYYNASTPKPELFRNTWIKNRNPYPSTLGVNLDYNFGTGPAGAMASFVNNRTYAGPSPFSEAETHNIETLLAYVNSTNPVIGVMHLTDGAPYILRPLGGSRTNSSIFDEDLSQVSQYISSNINLGAAVGTSGLAYKTARLSAIQPHWGSLLDWVDSLGIPSLKVQLSATLSVQSCYAEQLDPETVRTGAMDAWFSILTFSQYCLGVYNGTIS